MKKKILNFMLIAAMLICSLFFLTGCGNKNEETKVPKEEGEKISSKVKIGDYVDYKPEVGKSYTVKGEDSGVTSTQVFEVTGNEKWRVLKVNDDGTIDLVSAEGLTTKNGMQFATSGTTGLLRYQDNLNKISEIYGTGKYAIGTRNWNLDDVYTLVGWENIANYYGLTYNGEASKEEIYKVMNKRYGSLGTVTNSRSIYYPSLTGGNENGYITQTEFEVKSDVKADFRDNLRSSSSLSKQLDLYNKDTVINSMIVDSWIADVLEDYSPNGPAFADADTSIVWGVYSIMRNGDLFGLVFAWNDPMTEGSYKNSGGMNYVRPVITLSADALLGEGAGTELDPYTLK